TDVWLDFGWGLPTEGEDDFLDDVLTAVIVHEQTADVGQQRSFKPPGRRDHPFVVLTHARSFVSVSYNGRAGDFLRGLSRKGPPGERPARDVANGPALAGRGNLLFPRRRQVPGDVRIPRPDNAGPLAA